MFGINRSPAQPEPSGLQIWDAGSQRWSPGLKISKLRSEKPCPKQWSVFQTEPYVPSYGQKPRWAGSSKMGLRFQTWGWIFKNRVAFREVGLGVHGCYAQDGTRVVRGRYTDGTRIRAQFEEKKGPMRIIQTFTSTFWLSNFNCSAFALVFKRKLSLRAGMFSTKPTLTVARPQEVLLARAS